MVAHFMKDEFYYVYQLVFTIAVWKNFIVLIT